MSTHQTLFNPDDPRLTAYALGELSDPAERAQVEELLSASPEARAELADIRSLTAALTAEYEAERAAAETLPTNVVAMPRSVWRTPAPWLKVAAMLAVVGLAVGIALPVYHSEQLKSRHGLTVNEDKPSSAKAAPTFEPNQDAPLDRDLPTVNQFASKKEVAPAMPAAVAMPTPNQLLASRGDVQDQRYIGMLAPPPPADNSGADPMVASAGSVSNAATLSTLRDLATGIAPAKEKVVLQSGPTTYTGTTTIAAGTISLGTDKSSLIAPLSPPVPPVALAKGGPVIAKDMKSFSSAWAAPGGSGGDAPDSEAAKHIVVTGSLVADSTASSDANLKTVTRRPEAGETTGRASASVGGSLAYNEPPASQPAAAPMPARGLRIEADKSMASLSNTNEFPGWDNERQRRAETADYTHTVENAFLAAKEAPLSTFSIDVDTASYAITRRFIEAGSLPPKDAVRVEELLNYFPYSDAPPAVGSDKPFAIHLEAAACPWNTAHRLVRIGIKGKEIDTDKRPPSNLVFLLDVSGSMSPEERLPLIKRSLRLMVEKLREDDHVAIAVYAGESGLALPPTSGDHKDTILRAIENLRPGGSTNGASGIKLAYNVARRGFIKGGTNRVILATDGDFNVGVTNRRDLLRLIEEERKDGVFLSVLGVGTDNLKDSTMTTLADHGNGNYNYIDRLEEGRKVLVNQMSGTLVAIAKDVKIQVEFNPAAVAAYRLIGYEKRMLKKEDFNNDKIDAGEIGAGHSVTALYEIVPAGQSLAGVSPGVDTLKYQAAPAATAPPLSSSAPDGPVTRVVDPVSQELLTVKMRHKAPDSDKSERSYEEVLVDQGAPGEFANASADFQFSAAVASFGMVLRDSPHRGDATLGSALELAQAGKGEDPNGYRAGFLELVRQARGLEHGRR